MNLPSFVLLRLVWESAWIKCIATAFIAEVWNLTNRMIPMKSICG